MSISGLGQFAITPIYTRWSPVMELIPLAPRNVTYRPGYGATLDQPADTNAVEHNPQCMFRSTLQKLPCVLWSLFGPQAKEALDKRAQVSKSGNTTDCPPSTATRLLVPMATMVQLVSHMLQAGNITPSDL